jgi:hypothetical protein
MLENTAFQKLRLFASSGQRMETPTLLGNLERSQLNHCTTRVQVQSYSTTNGQSANLSWYQATIWDPRPIILFSVEIVQTFAFCF